MRVALTTRTTVAGLAALSLAAVTLPMTAASAAPSASIASVVAGDGQTYIVTLRHGNLGRGLAGEVGKKGAKVRHVYEHALQGFAADLSPGLLAQLRVDKRVASIELDRVVTTDGSQSSPPWGLDRIDQVDLPLSKTYDYSATGRGVSAYVIDTGVRSTHVEFQGRVAQGFDAVAGTTSEDCHGHGTHVAGTIAGTTYGVAKSASIVPVRVMNCDGSGSTSAVIRGVDWVTGHHVSGAPAVANISIGGGVSSTLDAAVAASIADGVVYAVSAGNGGTDACSQSPARLTQALTVGSTDASDTKAGSSNYGTCVDLFAPGVGVYSATYTSDTAATYKSGTSMATPHVAGAAAVYLEAHPGSSAGDVTAALVSAGTTGVVKAAGTGSPNRLLRSDPGSSSAATEPVTTEPTPTDPTAEEPASTEPAPATAGSGIRLGVSVAKKKGTPYASLSWAGATTTSVDVWRDGRRTSTTKNDGAHTEPASSSKGGGSATFKLCEAGTTTCSAEVTASW